MQNNKPNLFHWATSELSQDAFLCWLLSWANSDYATIDNNLHIVSKQFISYLTKYNIKENDIKSIKIEKQRFNIDILVTINDCYYIVIEDKVNASETGNQLKNYAKIVEEHYKIDKDKLFLIYLKTGDEGNSIQIQNKGYYLVLRKDLLSILEKGISNGISNDIYVSFYTYIKEIESSVNSYQILPLENWHWDSWKGFYNDLQARLRYGTWGYVPQKNGGFLGFWWCWNDKKVEVDGVGYKYYLQIEHDKFCFKIRVDNKNKARIIRDAFRKELYKKAKEHNIMIHQNGRIGKTMTVAALNHEFRQKNNGIIDMDKTIEDIRKIEIMMKDIFK